MRAVSFYDLRISTRFESYLVKLLWFGCGRSDWAIKERVEVASDLFETSPSVLHSTARQIKQHVPAELKKTVNTVG